MKRLTFLLLLFPLLASAQFRMVGTADASWTVVDDSTYTVGVTFQSDLTGNGYLATQITTSFRMFTPTEQVYRVSVAADLTFNTATLTVVEYGGTDGTPVGQLMVYNPDGNTSVPQAPFGSTGSTAQMQAAIDSYNARLIGTGGGSSTASGTSSTNTFDVISGTNVQTNLASIDSALVKARGTELFSGGAVTINSGDNTAFDVAATIGQIKANTGYYNINYPGSTAIAASSIAAQSTYVYIDSTGSIGQQTTAPTETEFREKLYLARLASNGSNFVALEELKNPSGQYTNLVRDLVGYIPLVKQGMTMTGNANLTFSRSAGSTFELGANFSNDPLDPNTNSFSALDSVTFFLLKQDGTVASGQVDVPVDQYDNGGTLTNLANNNFVIHTVYVFTSGNTTLQYGQSQYNSLDDAQAAINTRSFVLAAANANGTRIGWIIVQEGATDLSNTAQARFIEDVGQSSTSVSVPGALLATNNLSDVDDAATARANLGAGDVIGPGISTDNAVATFDGPGNTIQSSSVTVDDSGNIATSGTVDGRDVSADGTRLDGMEDNATADQTGEEMRDALEALSGGDRLDASAIQNLPSASTGVDSVANYTNLRAYTGSANAVYVEDFSYTKNDDTYETTGGLFLRAATGSENGATLIQASNGVKWKRQDLGYIMPDWYTDSTEAKRINAAFQLAGNGGIVHFRQNKTYTLYDVAYIDSLQYLKIVGNNAELKRCDKSESTATVNTSYSGGTTLIVNSIPKSWEIGDILYMVKDVMDDSISRRSVITNIVGTTVTLSTEFKYITSATMSGAPGTIVAEDLALFAGRPSANEGGFDEQGTNQGIIIERLRFNGNKANNDHGLSWRINATVGLHGQKSVFYDCDFYDTPAENVLGHGFNMINCRFKRLNGSAIHYSANDTTFLLNSPSIIMGCVSDSTNMISRDTNRHNEGGFITYSWNGGEHIVSNNFVYNIFNEAIIGTVTGALASDNSRDRIAFFNNVCVNAPKIVNSFDASSGSVSIMGNHFDDCGTLDTSSGTLASIPIKICGNHALRGTTITTHVNHRCDSGGSFPTATEDEYLRYNSGAWTAIDTTTVRHQVNWLTKNIANNHLSAPGKLGLNGLTNNNFSLELTHGVNIQYGGGSGMVPDENTTIGIGRYESSPDTGIAHIYTQSGFEALTNRGVHQMVLQNRINDKGISFVTGGTSPLLAGEFTSAGALNLKQGMRLEGVFTDHSGDTGTTGQAIGFDGSGNTDIVDILPTAGAGNQLLLSVGATNSYSPTSLSSATVRGGVNYWTQLSSDLYYNTGKVSVNTSAYPGRFNMSGDFYHHNQFTLPTYGAHYYRTVNPNAVFKAANAGVFDNGGGLDWRRVSTNEAVMYEARFLDGTHRWFTASSGSAESVITWDERMTILNNGNVGIGDNTPSTALEVAGTVTATAFVGDGTGLTGISTTDDQTAAEVSYSNSTSGLTATDTQAAIDETVAAIPDNITDLTISSTVNFNTNRITGLANAQVSTDAVNRTQLDSVGAIISNYHTLDVIAPSDGDTIVLTNKESLIVSDGLGSDLTIYLDGSAISSGSKVYIKYGNTSTSFTVDRDDDNDPGNFIGETTTTGSNNLSASGAGTMLLMKSGATWYQIK